MDYRMLVYPVETESGTEWIAEYPDIKYCSGSGETPQEAIQVAEINKQRYIEEAKELGEDLPTPSNIYENNYSGKFTVRISKTQHRKLSEYAECEGVSINQIVGEAISERIGQPNTKTVEAATEMMGELSKLLKAQSLFVMDTRQKMEMAKANVDFNREKEMENWQNIYKSKNNLRRSLCQSLN